MKKVLLSMMFLLLTGTVFAQKQVIIAGENVCLRSCADEKCKITGQDWAKVNTGELYDYMGEEKGYYAIKVEGKQYYIPKKYGRIRKDGKMETAETESASYIIIAGDDVCLRSCADEKCKITGQAWAKVNTGDKFEYIGTKGDYYAISTVDGIFYIPKKYGRLRE